jgi:hypothetical protein
MEKSKLTETENGETANIMRFVHKEFVLACQSNPHTTMKYYGDCMKIREDFINNFGINYLLLHQDNTPSYTSFYTREFLTKHHMTVVPCLPYSPDLGPPPPPRGAGVTPV